MNTDMMSGLKNANNVNLLLKSETEKILGYAFDVLNELGRGFHEKIHENSVVVAFQLGAIPFEQQRKYPRLKWERVVL